MFLREEQILPRPLLFLVSERDIDDAHELGLDDVPVAGLVVLHQHLVRSLGPHGHDQPPARLQLLQQLQHGEIPVSRGKKTPQTMGISSVVEVVTEDKLAVVPSFSLGTPSTASLTSLGTVAAAAPTWMAS